MTPDCYPQNHFGRQLRSIGNLFLLVVVGLVFLSQPGCWSQRNAAAVLEVSCAASLQQPISKLADRFGKLHSIRVCLQFGGTSMLINQVKLTANADVLITADQFSTDQLIASRLCSDCVPVVVQTPVIATAIGLGSKVCHRADLFQEGLRIGLGSLEATSIGKATSAAFGADSTALFQRATVIRTTVTALATDLKLGSVDVGIVWDSTARQFELTTVVDDDLARANEVASACVMSHSMQKDMAKRFVQYVTDSSDAEAVFSDLQFQLPNKSRLQGADRQ